MFDKNNVTLYIYLKTNVDKINLRADAIFGFRKLNLTIIVTRFETFRVDV